MQLAQTESRPPEGRREQFVPAPQVVPRAADVPQLAFMARPLEGCWEPFGQIPWMAPLGSDAQHPAQTARPPDRHWESFGTAPQVALGGADAPQLAQAASIDEEDRVPGGFDPRLCQTDGLQQDSLCALGAPFNAGPSAALTNGTTRPELLFDAVTRGDFEAVQGLLQSGVNVNESTERGSHILFRAVIKAHGPEIVRLLLLSQADVRSEDEKGNSVMHFWARATVGRNDLVAIGEALVQARGNVDAQRAADKMSPLHHVAIGHNNRRGWLDFHKALFLLRHGANRQIVTERGQMPCHLLTKDSRESTQRLMYVLTYGIGSAYGQWPRCQHADCVWCN